MAIFKDFQRLFITSQFSKTFKDFKDPWGPCWILDSLEDKLDDRSLYLVEETVKRLTPAIIKYINKELK